MNSICRDALSGSCHAVILFLYQFHMICSEDINAAESCIEILVFLGDNGQPGHPAGAVLGEG